ncbi:MAG TPA: glycosyltransferase family 2 protein [Thermoanaerobaculia bacterium]|nr:glycosyltransferase family 2 protein [Thermoanaerobaculia bacterium]
MSEVSVDVSVVMAVYNGESVAGETVESVLAQEGVALELIVVDDGSTDRTAEIVEDLARRDPRIRLLRREHRGLTSALIAGCASARAPLIARQDAGDLSLPGRLARLRTAFERTADLAFASSWTDYRGPEMEPLSIARGSGRAAEPIPILDESETHGVVDGPTHHGAVMFRRSAFERAGGYREEFHFGQDWDLWYRLAELGTFQMIGETLYLARVFPRSLSSANRRKQQEISRLSRAALSARLRGESEREILERAAAIRPSPRDRSRAAASAGYYFLGERLRRNRDPRAAAYLLRALRLNPLHAKAWVRLAQHALAAGR